ncbi:MAG: hypothetical protein EHM61_11225 [Acidobacteria bacterium]|nr:MAG: hypothetical protein EHM61_11225 [Acidobacteriota bacterium]
MRFKNALVGVIFSLNLLVLVYSQPEPASQEAAEAIYNQTWVEWPAFAPERGAVLTIAGPKGLYLRQEYGPGGPPRFVVLDEQGRPRPEGIYKWELVGQAGRVSSGWFEIRGGKIAREQQAGERQPVMVEDGAPENTIYADREGRVGIGTSMPATQLHVKGEDPGVTVEDTQTGGHEYVLRSIEGGDGSIGLFDKTKGQARWIVDSEGRMGINTTDTTSTLTVDGYIESTKGFLVNGRPLGSVGGVIGMKPQALEGINNNYFGTGAGASNTTGYYNSYFGAAAGQANTSGYDNSFFGNAAGYDNTSGSDNAFFGRSSGLHNSDGERNSFFGAFSGVYTTTGNRNSAFGRSAGNANTVENGNTFIGAYADLAPGASPSTNPVINATAIGYRAYVGRSNSVVLGAVNGFNSASAETFVGIGTPIPDRQLVVEGSQALGKFRRYNDATPSHAPAFLFERGRGTNTAPSDILTGDYLGKVQFRGRVIGEMLEYGALVFIASSLHRDGRFAFVDRDLATERMVVLNTGNVGIGTSTPSERLHVAGNVRVTGSILYGAPAAPVPDYVFEPDYQLTPLPQLERYVKSEKHLPDVPKASEIRENGVNLGEFQMQLLRKIEELTLYTVEQAKVIDRQNTEVSSLKREATVREEEAAALKDRVEALEQMVKRLVAETAKN